MKKKLRLKAVSLLLICLLLVPALAQGAAVLSSGMASITGFVSSLEEMADYANAFAAAATAQDFLNIALTGGFQQDAANLIANYNAMKSAGWVSQNLAQTLSFQQSVQNLLASVSELSGAAATGYLALIADQDFLQDIVNFIDSYTRLPDSLYAGYTEFDDTAYGGTGFYPVYALRTGIPATLTMKLSTRLGPGTAYSEELGTLPQTTPITVFEQVTMHGVPWVMVEYEYKSQRYRAYTGMKRVSASQTVPTGNTDPQWAVVLEQTEAYYGPGTQYARHAADVPAGTALEVYGVENGFLLCDYQGEVKIIRAYLPLDSRIEKTE